MDLQTMLALKSLAHTNDKRNGRETDLKIGDPEELIIGAMNEVIGMMVIATLAGTGSISRMLEIGPSVMNKIADQAVVILREVMPETTIDIVMQKVALMARDEVQKALGFE